MNVWIEQDDLAWLWQFFRGPTVGDAWAEASIIRTVIEAMQQSPEAIAILCRLRDEYNAEADRHAVVRVLSDPKDLRCDRCSAGYDQATIRENGLKPGEICPRCMAGTLRPIS